MGLGEHELVVIKLGGSSLSDGKRILRISEAVAGRVRSGSRVVVVASAIGRSTDELIEIVEEACGGRASPEELDEILSMGERTSVRILTAALHAQGIPARYLDPTDPDWPILTDGRFTNADVLAKESAARIKEQVLPIVEKGAVAVIPGFIGRDVESGKITTFGRGGSDITALVVANSINADEVLFVTDVEGIMSADPKLVNRPYLLKELTVDKLIGLTDVGSKFLHMKALKYKSNSIDLRVADQRCIESGSSGTIVKGSFPELEVELSARSPVMSVTIVGEALAESPEIMSELIEAVKKLGIPLYGISSDYDSIILYLRSVDDRSAFEKLHKIVRDRNKAIGMAVRKNLALIKVKGVGLEEKPGVVSLISEPLQKRGFNIFGMFTITSSVFTLVDWDKREEALQLIKKSLRGG
jgi:aspartate kinase